MNDALFYMPDAFKAAFDLLAMAPSTVRARQYHLCLCVAGAKVVRHYYAKRILRVVPAYYVALAFKEFVKDWPAKWANSSQEAEAVRAFFSFPWQSPRQVCAHSMDSTQKSFLVVAVTAVTCLYPLRTQTNSGPLKKGRACTAHTADPRGTRAVVHHEIVANVKSTSEPSAAAHVTTLA